MIILPAIDIKDGNCVRLFKGDYSTVEKVCDTPYKAAEQFKEDLERRTGLEVILWDERLSTVEAERILMDTGVRRENRKQYVDKMAAAVILQNYLDSQAHEGQTE